MVTGEINLFLRIHIYCSLQQFPKPKEAMKYAFSLLRQIREKIYGDMKFIPERMAVAFGREGSDRPLNIMTFDETVLQIPGIIWLFGYCKGGTSWMCN